MLDETPPDWVAFRTLLADLHDDLPLVRNALGTHGSWSPISAKAA